MTTDITSPLDKKLQRDSMEKELRSAGQKLDTLWVQARSATGQSRTDIHKQIGALRKKLAEDRKDHDALKQI